MNEQQALEYLNRDGNLRVPCSRYGHDTFSCSPVAYRLAVLIADASGEELTEERLDTAMGLVVNNHSDVQYVLTEHGGTPEDYEMANYECEICGDQHGEDAHGEPLVQRDQYVRSTTEAVEVYGQDALSILADHDDGAYVREGLWTARGKINELLREYRAATDDERDEYAPEYLDDIDAILSDAGFHPVTNSEGGAWLVYGPARIPSPAR